MMAATSTDISNWKKFHELFAGAFIYEALGAAVELGVAEAVENDPISAAEIAARLSVDKSALYRLLRALAAYGIFEESSTGFRHNSFSMQLRKDHPFTIVGMVQLWGSVPLRKAWNNFPAAIRDGRAAFVHGNGLSIYEYLQEHPEMAALFNQAMENNSAVVASSIAHGFPFGDFQSVLDLGGGVGTLLTTLLEAHTHLTGAVYDLPYVQSSARSHFASRALLHRAQFIEGDWFESVPSGFDIYVVKNSLWNWNDAKCEKILASIRRAFNAASRLLVIEYFPNSKTAPWSTAFDLQQLNVTGGRGRTVEEYTRLLDNVGMQVASYFQIENQQVLQCKIKG